MSLGGARPSTPTSRIFTIRGLSRSPGGWKVYRIRGSGKISWWWRERMLPESRAVTVLLGLTLAFYHGLWLPGLVLIKRDAFRFFLPLKQYLVERLTAGELPQWFPYEALARPFIGVTHTGVFHPFTALYFLLPVPDAYRVSTLLSCLLGSVGAFALGRSLKLSHTGSLVTGLTFALSGYVVSMTDNILYLYSICLLPLFCADLEKALTGPRIWTVAPAVVWGTVFLQGDVQTGYYYGFIALLWMGARSPEPYRETTLRLVLIGGLAALLAGIQLGPAWAVFANTDRTQPTLFHEQALHWSTNPLRLLTVLASPGLEPATRADVANFFFGIRPTIPEVPGGLWAESLYLGVPVTGLALLGARHCRDLRALALLGGIALLLALGRYGGLYELFYRVVPLWSAFRYPEKLMGIALFAIAMLAGAGLDALRQGKGGPAPWLAAAILSAAAGFSLHTDAASAWTTTSFAVPEALAREMTESAGRAWLSSSVAALGMGVVVTGARKRMARPELLLAGLVMIITLHLARGNLAAYHIAPAGAATFVPPFVYAIAAPEGALGPGRFRMFSIPEGKIITPTHLTNALGIDGAASVARRQALDLEHNAQFHLETFNLYLSSQSSRFSAFLNVRLGVAGAARYNVAYYIGRRARVKDPQFTNTLLAELPEFGLALFHSSIAAKPRAYLSQRPELAASPVEPAALLARPDFLNGEVDLIETAASLPGPSFSGRAVLEHYAPEEVDVRVETPQPVVLILLDSYERGWTATLESGAELPILRANALVRAVVVPVGAHLITFSYQTP